MLYGLIIIPLVTALIALFIPDNRQRPLVLPVAALLHTAMTVDLLLRTPTATAGGWLLLDPLGMIVLAASSLLFLVCACYAVGYLAMRQERDNRNLCACLLVCLAAMSLSCMARHMGLFWVALETTTLTMAPLIYFNRNARSLEATWKYMVICSVGIALALLGLYFLAYSTVAGGHEATLLLEPLLAGAQKLSPAWLGASFIFLLVGFGTKMGLAPLHTWKPDAYGEAPGLVGALLAGGLVNTALLGLLRIYQICTAAGAGDYCRNILLATGLVSMLFAAVFMARQSDFKRMLAYSSVEHVGIMAVALGLGKGAFFGLLFHMLNNSLTKGVLFLTSGNIHRSYGSKNCERVRGALRRLPWSAGLFMAAFFAVTGSPPFALFTSEYSIISQAFTQGRPLTGGVMLLLLGVIFIGMAITILPMVGGSDPDEAGGSSYRERLLTVAPPLALILVVLFLGVWLPPPLSRLLTDGARLLEGTP